MHTNIESSFVGDLGYGTQIGPSKLGKEYINHDE
jgi:hypothetical protein